MIYNFNPNPDEIAEFVYVEIMDSVGINMAERIQGFSQIYGSVIPNDRDLTKLNKRIVTNKHYDKTHWKHEYYNDYQLAVNEKGLFGIEKVMAYLFVFDYNNEQSFYEVLNMAKTIISIESNKLDKEELKTIKIFVGNKFDSLIYEYGSEPSKTTRNSFDVFMEDSKAKYYLNGISSLYKQDPKDYIIFTSAKNNINIGKLFTITLNKINQRDSLWNKIEYDPLKSLHSQDDRDLLVKKKNKNLLEKIFFCCSKRDDEDENTEAINLPLKTPVNDHNDTDYDKNQSIEHLKTSAGEVRHVQEEKKCIIF